MPPCASSPSARVVPRENAFMAHLSDVERLTLFKELVNEYHRMAAAFPVDSTDLSSIQGWSSASDHWQQLIRAFALRKFFLQKSDPVHCHMVYRSYLNALGEPLEADQTFEEYAASVAGLVGDFKLPGGAVTAGEVVEDILYGIYLHGYAERYAAVKKLRLWFGDEDALVRSWATAAEKHLRGLAHQVLMAELAGRIHRPE